MYSHKVTQNCLNGNKCVATTSTSTSSTSTSTSFANFSWHKPSPGVEENRNCTFISSTSTNIEDNSINHIQQTDVLDLSVLKTEKVDDPEYYEDNNTYNRLCLTSLIRRNNSTLTSIVLVNAY